MAARAGGAAIGAQGALVDRRRSDRPLLTVS
jgi:hypothetical protein